MIFTSVRAPHDEGTDDGYDATAAAMEQLAARQPGYLGIDSVRNGATRFGITVSYWRTEADARAWKAVHEHLIAQQRGRERWYERYEVHVATVTRTYGYSSPMPTQVVNNNPERSRYELLVDGEVAGFADYHVDGRDIVFPHTEIDPSRRGQGLGAVLVRGALDDVAKTSQHVVAQCWYVADFIGAHPEYAPLLERREGPGDRRD